MTDRRSPLLLPLLTVAALGAALLLDLAPVGAHPTASQDAAPAGAEPMEFDSYQLVLLNRPAHRPDVSDDEARKIQAAHLGHIRRMAEEGYAVVAGPFGDQDDERKRGLVLYRVGSVDEARRLAEQDPAVQAGLLEVEVMTWYTEKGALAFPGVEGIRKDGAEE